MSRWRHALALAPHYYDYNNWPLVEVDALPVSVRSTFLRNQQVACCVLNGDALNHVAERVALSPGRITQLLNRCFTEDHDGQWPLTKALIPHQHLKANERLIALPSVLKPSGEKGAFQALLSELPSIEVMIDEAIAAHLKKARYAPTLLLHSIFGMYKQCLVDAHWPHDRYPYTTNKYGYESLRRHIHKKLANALQARERTARMKFPASQPPLQVMDRVEIDEQVIDFQGRLTLCLNDELIPLRLARATLLIAVDVASSCYLGYHLSLTDHPSALDLQTLLDNCLQSWQPMTLTSPLFTYDPGATFPSSLPDLSPLVFERIALDNAWMHHAKAIEQLVVVDQGATLEFGHPKHPVARSEVERAFDYINRHHSHKLPSTTGSHPRDPKREDAKNRTKPPAISLQTFEEALSIVLTQHNVLSKGGRNAGSSPLTLFAHQWQHHWHPSVSEDIGVPRNPFRLRLRLPIKRNRDSGQCYLYFERVHYYLGDLARLAPSETHVYANMDARDIRKFEVDTEMGRPIGVATCSRSWQRFPHSITIRKYINKLIRHDKIQARDPLAGLLHYLLKHKQEPKHALRLLHVATTFQSNGDALDLNQPERVKAKRQAKANATWSSQTAFSHPGEPS